MHIELERIISPEDNTVLWRYMSLEKFANILEKQSLFSQGLISLMTSLKGIYLGT